MDIFCAMHKCVPYKDILPVLFGYYVPELKTILINQSE